jgi:hypothetical protein
MSAQENSRKVALGGLLHRIGSFDPKSYETSFNSRLVLQKTVYLMEQFGLNIGYSFSWYLRGPYSPNLTRDTYELLKSYSEVSPVKFVNPDKEKRFCEFLNFIRPISDNHSYLERVAVVHFLCMLYRTRPNMEIFAKVNNKLPSVTFREFQEIIELLRNYNLLENE